MCYTHKFKFIIKPYCEPIGKIITGYKEVLIFLGGVVQQMLVCNSPRKLSPSKSGCENGKSEQLDSDMQLAMSLAASESPTLAALRVDPPPNLPGREQLLTAVLKLR